MTTTHQPQFTVRVSLTEEAATQIRTFMDAEQVPLDEGGLRVSVLPGGCSGFKYGLNIEETPAEDDIVLELQGVRLFVDAFSAQYLDGITIGHHSSTMGTGFTFENPNATGGCGCGSSFAV
ncbi:MAG TPA: iron-sulfur cluster assembly accessory protein [Gemmatimonadales bacterium]